MDAGAPQASHAGAAFVGRKNRRSESNSNRRRSLLRPVGEVPSPGRFQEEGAMKRQTTTVLPAVLALPAKLSRERSGSGRKVEKFPPVLSGRRNINLGRVGIENPSSNARFSCQNYQEHSGIPRKKGAKSPSVVLGVAPKCTTCEPSSTSHQMRIHRQAGASTSTSMNNVVSIKSSTMDDAGRPVPIFEISWKKSKRIRKKALVKLKEVKMEEGDDPSCKGNAAYNKSLELFNNMLKSFVYCGKTKSELPVSLTTVDVAVGAAKDTCSNAHSLLGRSTNRKRKRRTINSICKTTTPAIQDWETPMESPLLACQQGKVCRNRCLPVLLTTKRDLHETPVTACDPDTGHPSASKKVARKWKMNPLPAIDEGNGLLKAVKCKGGSAMTMEEKMKDAYLRVSPSNDWIPPHSPFELLQEEHMFDPWRILVICMLLNRTSGAQVNGVLRRLFCLCPAAEDVARVPVEDLAATIQTLGLQNKRARAIKHMSAQYLQDGWTHVTQLHGVGK